MAGPAVEAADLVHLHSNGLLTEVVAPAGAHGDGMPTVLTLYGTEIWHYRPKLADRPLHTRCTTAPPR